jgi:hypothetical protein
MQSAKIALQLFARAPSRIDVYALPDYGVKYPLARSGRVPYSTVLYGVGRRTTAWPASGLACQNKNKRRIQVNASGKKIASTQKSVNFSAVTVGPKTVSTRTKAKLSHLVEIVNSCSSTVFSLDNRIRDAQGL